MNPLIFENIITIFKNSNPWVIGSWNIASIIPLGETEAYDGGLEMVVSGRLYIGRIRVTINWMDLYDVALLNDDGTVSHQISDIYSDNLVQVINGLIGTQSVI